MSDDATDVTPVQEVPVTPEPSDTFDPDDHGAPVMVAPPAEPERKFVSNASPEGPLSITSGKAGTVDGLFFNYGDVTRFLPKPIAEDMAKFILNK
jgi:hypothetical protein